MNRRTSRPFAGARDGWGQRWQKRNPRSLAHHRHPPAAPHWHHQGIERGFRVLKSEIEIGPVFHRLPARIKAHATICFIALILYRVMRQRLSSADAYLSPERALEELQKLQPHQIRSTAKVV
jgi:hypothetical protein